MNSDSLFIGDGSNINYSPEIGPRIDDSFGINGNPSSYLSNPGYFELSLSSFYNISDTKIINLKIYDIFRRLCENKRVVSKVMNRRENILYDIQSIKDKINILKDKIRMFDIKYQKYSKEYTKNIKEITRRYSQRRFIFKG